MIIFSRLQGFKNDKKKFTLSVDFLLVKKIEKLWLFSAECVCAV
jgi:hypothetical protein